MIPKFRAWSKLASKMYIVNGLYFDRGIVQYANNDNAIRFIKLKNIILMQSTGLKDKNGKEIFEGDIITNGMDIVDVRNHGTLGFYTLVNGREVFFGHGTSIEEFEEDIDGFTEIVEIIGNIYENPELLEVEE